MNIILSNLFNDISKCLSVGTAIQNALFYSFITFLVMTNIYLVRRKRAITREQIFDDSNTLADYGGIELSIDILKVFFLPHHTEEGGGDPQIAGNMFLIDPLLKPGVMPAKFKVSLFGCQ